MPMSNRENLDFYSLSESDQEWFLRETWCDVCNKADIGMKEPELYIEDGVKHIAGKCIVCNTPCVSTITEHNADG